MDPVSVVVLGASGDLAARLLIPALHRLHATGKLPGVSVIGYSPDPGDDASFRSKVIDSVRSSDPGVARGELDAFVRTVSYRRGDLGDEALAALRLVVRGSALFYLALPPDVFAAASRGLERAGLNQEGEGWRRMVIEKPFGRDLASARALNKALHAGWREDQIFRIDHFLGKESVQNLLVFRLANRFLDPVLNGNHVDHVQITAAETLGLEGRHRYYEMAGALRDMLQNHLMQIFAFAAMEPPARWDTEVLRDHKVEVLKAVEPLTEESMEARAARGRYTAGEIGGRQVVGYLDEPGVAPDSSTETLAALRLHVDTWRWKGVPFYLRTGKCLARSVTEVAIRFKEPPTRLFAEHAGTDVDPNLLLFTMRPQEAIELSASARRPGLGLATETVVLRAEYAPAPEADFSAYEQLLLDAIAGDHTSFVRFDEAELAWEVVAPALQAWKTGQPDPYPAGSDGPPSQDALLAPGHRWRPLV